MSNLSLATNGLAFAVGALTTYFDCHQTLTSRLGRVPETFRLNGSVIALSVFCGGIAVAACVVTGYYPDATLSTVLTLKSADPYRGFVVGASVLVLIRSKLFNIENSPFGGDYLYDLARNTAIDDVNRKWTVFRSNFQNRNIAAALQDPQFEPAILALMSATLQARPASAQTMFNPKIQAVTGNRPADTATVVQRTTYYRALIGLALDACGPTVVQTLQGFT